MECRNTVKQHMPGTYTVIDLIMYDADKLESRATAIQLNAKSRSYGKHQMQTSSIFAKMWKSNVDHNGDPITVDRFATIARELSTDLLRMEPWDHVVGEPEAITQFPRECYNTYTQEQYNKKE